MTLVRSPVEVSLYVLHRAVLCNTYLSWFTYLPAACHFYNMEETMFHVKMECVRLQPLFGYLKGLLLKFWLHFRPKLLIVGHPVCGGGETKVEGWRGEEDFPVGLLLSRAKIALQRSRPWQSRVLPKSTAGHPGRGGSSASWIWMII